MSARKVVAKELTRSLIMEAAHDLFIHEGYQHVSMRQIAKQLGYSHGALYYHFDNKAELFYAMVEQDFQLLNEKLHDVLQQDISPKEKLKAVLLGFIEFGLNNQSQYEVMFMVKDAEVKSYLQEAPNKSYELFVQALRLCSEKLNVKQGYSVFLSLHGFVSHFCREVASFDDVQSLAEAHVTFIIASIFSPTE